MGVIQTSTIDADAFIKTLRARMNTYFETSNQSVKSNTMMMFKIWLGLLWWVLSYVAIFLFSQTLTDFVLLYALHGLGHIFFSFNVGHDALHNALSKKNKINRWWAYSYDLLGVNTYMWRFMHHQGHHACLNISGEDMSLESSGILRLSHQEKQRPHHKFQHLYATIVYGLYLIYYVFIKDFRYFLSKNNLHLKQVKHPPKEYLKLLSGKLFYLCYMLLLPMYILPFEWYQVLTTFLITLFAIGVIMSITFQVTHIIDTTHYPQSNREYDNYIFHVFSTTADFSASSPLANFFFGGLNLHVVHHLRSDICHIHYPALTSIVRATAAEFGVPYRSHTNMWQAIKAHYRQLKKLGEAKS